ncbi:MAG: hypothetical protein H6807_14195 [Planctomycetes bacterium]|nr:hypothetical protein [Planctomycetota bacterium]
MTFLRFFGWLTSLALVVMLLDGILERCGLWWHPALHVGAGIGLLVLVPLLYILPYLDLIGLGTLLRRREDLAERATRLALLAELKGRLFWPVLRAILLLVAGPIAGFLERGHLVPAWTHGALMILHLGAHLEVWARSLFSQRLARELLAA